MQKKPGESLPRVEGRWEEACVCEIQAWKQEFYQAHITADKTTKTVLRQKHCKCFCTILPSHWLTVGHVIRGWANRRWFVVEMLNDMMFLGWFRQNCHAHTFCIPNFTTCNFQSEAILHKDKVIQSFTSKRLAFC